MFGIGLGEILLIVFIIFLISPRDIPKVMKKVGQFFGEMNRLKREVLKIKEDIEDIGNEVKIEEDQFKKNNKKKEGNVRSKGFKTKRSR